MSYDFLMFRPVGESFCIRASHGGGDRPLVPEICQALGLVAFDGQLVR